MVNAGRLSSPQVAPQPPDDIGRKGGLANLAQETRDGNAVEGLGDVDRNDRGSSRRFRLLKPVRDLGDEGEESRCRGMLVTKPVLMRKRSEMFFERR